MTSEVSAPGRSAAPGTLWIVPSERHVERWSQGGRRVETRAHLRERLFGELVRDRVLATPLEARMALAESLPAVAGRETLLAGLSRARGGAWERTLDAIDATLGALRAAAVPKESLARVGREAGGGTGGRARMLLAAMDAVDAVLDRRALTDPRGMGSLLAERIARHPASRVAAAVGATELVARCVLAWDGADAAWWRALDVALVRAGGRGAGVELPAMDERLDASRERGPLDLVSEDVARALDAPPRGIVIDAPLGDLRLIGGRAASSTPIDLRTATDAEAQARAVLDAVRAALLGGAAPEEIAITAGALDEAAVAALRRAFDEDAIPLHDARGEEPARAGIVRFALDALAAGERGLRRLDVAALARSRYLDAAKLDVEEPALTDLARALERTPTATATDPESALESTARASALTTRATPVDQARIAERRAALAIRLAEILGPAGHAKSRAAHVAGARVLLDRLGVDPLRAASTGVSFASDEPLGPLAKVERRGVARDARAWDALSKALADCEAAALRLGVAEDTVSAREFRHELALSLDARTEASADARAGAVRIADLDELAGEKLALLVVMDASDGSLPARGDGDGVPEGVASALRALDPLCAPPASSVRAARQLTWLALAAASARAIVLARRARDEDGAALAPASVVAWLEREGIVPSTWRASPLDGPAVTPNEALLRRMLHDGPSGAEASGVAHRARVERARESRFELVTPPAAPILGDLDRAAPLHEQIVAALLAETGGTDRPLAVTNLERFATCAFQGFATQVLHARPERPLREVPDRRESGTLLHRALAAAFTATGPLWVERPRQAERIREQCDAAVDAILQSESVASPLRRLALGRVRDAVRAVVRWSLASDEWDFVHAEQTFGDPRGGWPALVIEEGGVRLALRGSIDRVDVGHGRAAVRAIDYKTSPRSAESNMRSLGETAFQVALYARAASDALAATARAGLYLGATRPDDVGPKVKKDFEARWLTLHAASPSGVSPIERRALDLVTQVRTGAIAPRPKDETACTNCDASGGCRKPRFAIARDDDGVGA